MPAAYSDPNKLNHTNLSRNDSLKSERSDKRVSFNKDVGIKHIPRGLKRQAPQPPPKDEWGKCASVHKEPPPISSTELEKQAEDLVRLLDQVDCVTRPNSNKSKTPQFSSHSLDRANNKTNNNRLAKLRNNTVLNLARRNNLNNGSNNLEKSSATLEVKNKQPLINFGRRKPANRKELTEKRARPIQRSLSTHSYINELNSSDTDYPYEKPSRFKSEPDIQRAINYRKRKPRRQAYSSVNNLNITDNDEPMSVDNLYKDNRFYPNPYRRPNARNEYKSADNLTDVSIPGNRQLHEFKSVENLQSGYSSSDIDASYVNLKKPIRKFDIDDSQQVRSHKVMYEEPSNPRGLKSPNQYYGQNKNKPFSYTGGSLSSIEEVRKLSPSREMPRYGNEHYARINRNAKRPAMSSGREKDFNHKNEDYSAKIIINSQPARNRYDDDDAYETYQVRDGNLTKQIRDLGISSHLKNDYKNISNNNINMSSIGVQTEKVPKAPNRQRRQYRSPIRNGYSDESTEKKQLSSASLVRQVSHGFGRVERSPSPPPRVVASHRKPPRSIVPLLSDTDESEFNYKRNRDPLAKIRDQVKIREKLQEDKESEEREQMESRYYSNRSTGIKEYNDSKLQPLTIDEVDALEFEVDSRGRNSLVVAREGYPTNTPKYSNERPHMKKTENSEQNQPYPLKDRNVSYQIAEREAETSNDKNQSRFFSTLERLKKGATEKSKNILDRKDSKVKDKKKKKIKIKFFYDPRPEDIPTEDPLSRFTEYKGSSSDELTSSRNNQNYPGKKLEYETEHIAPYQDARSRSREATLERRPHYDSSSDKRDYSSSPSRPTRFSSGERFTGRDNSRNRSERESSNERTLNRTNNRKYSDDNKQPSGSYGYNSQYMPKDRKYSSEYEAKNHEYNRKDYHSTTRNQEYKDVRQERRDLAHNVNENIPYDRYGPNENRKSTEKNIALSDKYKSLTRSSSPQREIYALNGKSKNYPDDSVQTEDEEKLGKIQRQRKKFFGVLRGEGRTKPITKVSPGKNDQKSSSNTLSKTRGREGNQVEVARIIEKVKEQNPNGRHQGTRERYADDREKRQWENATLTKTGIRSKSKDGKSTKYQGDSSSSVGTPVNSKGQRSNSRQRYFGDTDSENKSRMSNAVESGRGDYRSLPNRKARSSTPNRFVMGSRRNYNARGMSPGARGSAGSSLQSSESEADSHGGSHASRASHISTGSNRSVYLHATAVADIPVRRGSDDSPSERGVSRQSKKVSRSFSLASPWKPRHFRDRYEVDYDNRETRESRPGRPKSSLPPRPPRKSIDPNESKRVGRSQTVYKDSRLAGWLRKKKNKEPGKGI